MMGEMQVGKFGALIRGENVQKCKFFSFVTIKFLKELNDFFIDLTWIIDI